MTDYNTDSSSASLLPPVWVRVLLAMVFIISGTFVLVDLALATIISGTFIGLTAIVAGVCEIAYAFWTKRWRGFWWQLLLGILYVTFGLALLRQPAAGAITLTYVLGLALIMSGLVRIIVGFSRWSEAGWIMLSSGVFGILAGLVILTGFPATGLSILGFLLGIDLLSHGAAWLVYACLTKARSTCSPYSG